MKKFLILIFLCSPSSIRAETKTEAIEEISDAIPLDDHSAPSVTESTSKGEHNTKGYAVISNAWIRLNHQSDYAESNPALLLNLSDKHQTSEQASWFLDASMKYTSVENNLGKKNSWFLNQLGFSWQADGYSLVLGKERHKKSPGLLVNPSDLLYGNQQLPGELEDKRGLWLARGSLQGAQFALDLIGLPYAIEDEHGLPEPREGKKGFLTRLSWHDAYGDGSLSMAELNDKQQVAAYIQGFIAKVWKTYVEASFIRKGRNIVGIDESIDLKTYLFGFGYEGSEDFSVRLESYLNDAGYSASEWALVNSSLSKQSAQMGADPEKSIFLRKHYYLSSLQIKEWLHRFHIFLTAIKSGEDEGLASISSLEWLAHDRHSVRVAYQFLNTSRKSQYAHLPYQSQALLAWHYYF